MKQEPDFDKAIEVHTAVKANQLNEFKQPATAATYLGIHERVLGKITGSVLVSPDDSTDAYKKINIGLQLKVRGTVRYMFWFCYLIWSAVIITFQIVSI